VFSFRRLIDDLEASGRLVRLEDEVDDVDVIQRVDDVLEHAAPGLRRFAFGQGGDGIVDLVVGPRHVACERPYVAKVSHGVAYLYASLT